MFIMELHPFNFIDKNEQILDNLWDFIENVNN